MGKGRGGGEEVVRDEALSGGGEGGGGGGGVLSFSVLGRGGGRVEVWGGGDWRWRLKGRGVWVVGLPFPKPFFDLLFRFFTLGGVESAMKLGMEVWIWWE